MMFPIYLPLWIVRLLPDWWRARRIAALERRFDAADARVRHGGWPPLVRPLPPPPAPPPLPVEPFNG